MTLFLLKLTLHLIKETEEICVGVFVHSLLKALIKNARPGSSLVCLTKLNQEHLSIKDNEQTVISFKIRKERLTGECD
jgi:hypothetical protein